MRFLFLLALLFSSNCFALSKDFTCDNGDVDTIESICIVDLNTKFTECKYDFSVGSAVLSDFDIYIDGLLEYSVSADYTTPTGHLWKVDSDLTSATVADHTLHLIRLSLYKTLEFRAAGTSSVITGTVTCNDL